MSNLLYVKSIPVSPIAPCGAFSSLAGGIGLAGGAGDGVGLVSKGGGLTIFFWPASDFGRFRMPMVVEGGRATSVLLDFRRFRIPVAVEGGGAPSVLLDFRRFLNLMAVEGGGATSVLSFSPREFASPWL